MALLKLIKHSGATFFGSSPSERLFDYLESDRAVIENKQLIEDLNKEIRTLKTYNERGIANFDEITLLGIFEEQKAPKRKFKPFILTPETRASVRFAIDNSRHKHKYISGVLSYSFQDTAKLEANPHIEDEFRELTELFAFAGIEEKDRLIYWVRHTDKDRVENHFVIPRVCLTTSRAFNPFPPKSEYVFNAFRDFINLKYDLDDPSTPKQEHLIANYYPPAEKFFHSPYFASKNAAIKEAAYKHLYEKIKNDGISSYDELIDYITSSTSEFTAETGLIYVEGDRISYGKGTSIGYITLRDKNAQRIRLRGFAFSNFFTKERLLTSRVEDGRINSITRETLLRELQKQMDSILRSRYVSNRKSAYGETASPSQIKRTRLNGHKNVEPLPKLTPIRPYILNLLNHYLSKGSLVVPEISDHMADFEIERALAARNAVLAEIESKKRRETLTLAEYIKIYQLLFEHIFGADLYAYYPRANGTKRTQDSNEARYFGRAGVELQGIHFKTVSSATRQHISPAEKQGVFGAASVENSKNRDSDRFASAKALLRRCVSHSGRVKRSSGEFTEAVRRIETNIDKAGRLISAYQRLKNKRQRSRIFDEPK
ncbi:relaxase/mobilization nuclease domain-containing protein [Enterovibrio norvegicus]|uniref:relaxase/mobilization nuclease domain-containing protein n=1 Tax=Enterovibrio norvegicus TaxID=188144 RepID=UPI0015E287F7|nr:relaxase/mobilization nuclease domain-containing protein [Enterovibrio norvegicus]